MQLQRGQKVDVTKGRNLDSVNLYLGWDTKDNNIDIDGAAFLLAADGKCRNDNDLIFYGNPTGANNAVTHANIGGSDKEQISVAFRHIPSDVTKIALTLTIHEGEKTCKSFASVSNIFLRVVDKNTSTEIMRYNFGEDLKSEVAIVVGELYLHNGEWKLNAIGSGFNGGLAALCNNFGIEVNEPTEPVQEAKPVAPPTPPAPPINITKVSLKKKESVSIVKSEKVTAKLKWDNDKKDLDLYCFYVTKDGENDKVYYRKMGSAHSSPYITLSGDSKVAGEEVITIHSTSNLKYVLFAAYSAVSNGIGSFKSMKARAEVDNHQGQVVIAPLLQNNMFAYWVAIASIDFTDNQQMKVNHVEKYSKSGSENSPALYEDGSFKMDAGPVEFK